MSIDAAVVVPNWNGADMLAGCLRSLLAQSLDCQIIVVDNGSTDNSLAVISSISTNIDIVALPHNTGFSGGVNAGIKRAMALGLDYVALFNNDAVADRDWLRHLYNELKRNPELGITTCTLVDKKRTKYDSTGEMFSVWGLAFPRGRGKLVAEHDYSAHTRVFGATGGASLYRIKMLERIGLFDEDFFAYYEDVDVSWRAQLTGWKVAYVPAAKAYHGIGETSARIKGFRARQAFKNTPLVVTKNVPKDLMGMVLPRFIFAYGLFLTNAIASGQGWPALKGAGRMLYLLPRKLRERKLIQKRRKVSAEYLLSIMIHDLPPQQKGLRKLRARWWRLTGRRNPRA